MAGLSVLIATRNRPAGLRRLLTALRPQVGGRPDRTIVVINDRSHNAEYAAVAAEFEDIVTYRLVEEPGGLVAARNAGLSLAVGAYSVFTDDDCEPPPWWLDWLSARIRLHPEADVVVGTTKPLWTTRSFRERLQGEWFLPWPWRMGDRDIFVTANAAIRSSLLRTVGGFGFLTFAGAGEDTELSIRLHRAGARFVIDRNWWVAHEVGDPVRTLVRRYRRYGEANARVAAASAVVIPPPPGADEDIRGAFPVARGLFRRFSAMSQTFHGNRVERAAAAVLGTAIQSAYMRGFSAEPK